MVRVTSARRRHWAATWRPFPTPVVSNGAAGSLRSGGGGRGGGRRRRRRRSTRWRRSRTAGPGGRRRCRPGGTTRAGAARRQRRPPITSRTAAPATAPPSRQLTERARPAARRHADRGGDRAGAQHEHERRPGEAGVGARAQAVDDGDRPAGVGQPVDATPGGHPDPAAEPAGDRDGEQHVEGQRPESHPDRAVGGPEGDHHVGQADGHVAVADGGDDVDADQRRCRRGTGSGAPTAKGSGASGRWSIPPRRRFPGPPSPRAG